MRWGLIGLAFLSFQACAKEWRMTADREALCNRTPFHLWRNGECVKVR